MSKVAHSNVDLEKMNKECQSQKNPKVAINSCTQILSFIEDLYGKMAKKDLAEKLSPFYMFRGHAFLLDHHYDKAISDVTDSAKINGEYTSNHLRIRGLAFFAKDEFKLAATDFKKASDLFPQSFSTLIWLYMSRKRHGVDGLKELESGFKRAGEVRGAGVPVQMFLGKASKKHLFTLGRILGLENKIILWFYVGQYELISGNTSAAKNIFSTIVKEGRGFDCVDTKGGKECVEEYWGAEVELRRLNNRGR